MSCPVHYAPRAVRRARTAPKPPSLMTRRALQPHGAPVPRPVHSCLRCMHLAPHATCAASVRSASHRPSYHTLLRFALPAHRPRLFHPFLWQQAALGFLRARAPPALHILALAPLCYLQLSSDFRLAREKMVLYLLHSWEGHLMP